MKVYVASSWRNQKQPEVVSALRAQGHDVYDFRNPEPDSHGFNWREIDPAWQTWTLAEYQAALNHPIARAGYKLDMTALENCDVCVLVMPCGRSAHLEAGYAIGAGKPTVILLSDGEPELMYKMARTCLALSEVVEFVNNACHYRAQGGFFVAMMDCCTHTRITRHETD